MSKKKFRIKVTIKKISEQSANIDVETTGVQKALGSAETTAEINKELIEWSKPAERSEVISSEFLEIIPAK